MDNWLVMSRCNRVAKQLFGKKHCEANRVARMPYQALTINGIPPEDLRDRRAEEFIESLVRENLNVANNLLTSAAPRLADELIQIALDPKVKAYARTQAISESFKILRENVLEAEQRRQLQDLRQTLQSLEDNGKQAIDV